MQWLATRLVSGRLVPSVLFMLFLVLFFGLTAPANLTEPGDELTFARATEECGIDVLTDPRLLGYHLLARASYALVAVAGFDVSGLALMSAMSTIFAALTLVLFGCLLHKAFGLAPLTSLLGTATLAVCYGFWRYSTVADVYALASMVVIAVFMMALTTRPGQSPVRIAGVGMVAGLAILIYQLSILPLLIALPIFFLQKGRLSQLAVYLLVCAGVVMLGYLLAAVIGQPGPLSLETITAFLKQRTPEVTIQPLSIGYLIKSPIKMISSFSHYVLSTNWLFGLAPLVLFVRRVFPTNFIEEEVYAAEQFSAIAYLGACTYVAGVVVLVYLVVRAGPFSLRLLAERKVLTCVAWIGIYVLFIGRVKPSATEAWIMVLPPLVILISVFLIDQRVRQSKLRAPLLLVLALLCHNAVGGIAVVYSERGDHARVKSDWLAENTKANDLFLMREPWSMQSPSVFRHVSHFGRATVAVMRVNPGDDARGEFTEHICIVHVPTGQWKTSGGVVQTDYLSQFWETGGRIYVYDEFFLVASWRERHFPRQFEVLTQAFAALRQGAVLVHQNELGRVWELLPPD